jgi:hypothetical protein
MKKIRESKFSKVVAYYLIMMMILQVTQPMQMYALTSGPTQPEFNAFTPIGTSDMVDLASGDFNYNIPIMDVGGYPLNLAYNSGVTMDQEASWTGLGWNLNVGQIERQMRGLPDDFKGDEMIYENNLKKNRTVGVNVGLNGALTGIDALKLGFGLGVESNNYEGISFKPSFGIGFNFSDRVSVGMDFSSSLDEGATVTPRVGISVCSKDKEGVTNSLSSSLSLGFNSRKGVENLNVSASVSQSGKTGDVVRDQNDKVVEVKNVKDASGGGGVGGSVSFNNLSYTPAKRIGFRNESFSFNGALGGEIFGVEGQVQVTGYGSYQTIANEYRNRKEKGFGYENTEYKGNQSGVLDFNRENEKTVSENTLSLPVTNYTYDLYSIDGQGISGQFRPYRSKVSSLYNDVIVDIGDSKKFGAEVGLGNLAHGSGDFKMAPSISYTGGWFDNNNVLPYFNEKNTDSKSILYEPTTYKMVGGMIIDPETIYKDKIHGTEALRLDIAGNKKNTYTTAYSLGGGRYYGNSEIKRNKRFLRSQLVQKITAKEGEGDKFIIKNTNAKPHHTAGVKIIKTDGSTYVYGNAVYNKTKVEASFDVSGQTGNNTTGLVGYNGSLYNNGTNVSDEFVNRITTPAFAHSYLLSSLLSSDYEDVDDNGPTINDLGSYTKFEYAPATNYNWRVPFKSNQATYNEGLISKKDDQKGNYLYGEKELKYLDKIITKSHVAFFDTEARKDAVGVLGQNGGIGSGRMKQLKSIRLYSRPEVTNTNGEIFDPNSVSGNSIKPIKTAHFIYSYNLCQGMPNNEKDNNINTPLKENELSNNGGKLTLEKVYFTYRGSNMGKYTPYSFDYGISTNLQHNPTYNAKGFDIWGNFKLNPENSGNVNSASLSNTEFPFVNQDKTLLPLDGKTQADINTQAWNLKSISLPSGGKITIDTESDDYQYVQNQKAMQMYKVVGVGHNSIPTSNDIAGRNLLYNGNSHKRFLYVKLSNQNIEGNLNTYTKFVNQYLKDNLNKPINFRFNLNMTGNQSHYEYVSGYLKIADTSQISVNYNATLGGTVASIPVQMLTRDKGNGSVNPIAKAGWGFGRTFMNRLVYGTNDNPAETDFKSIVKNLEGSIQMFAEIFQGPNRHLQDKGCARIFKPEKSWIRLENPDGHKFGGGLRVKSIKLSDNWTKMLDGAQGTNTNDMEFGQTYSYNDAQGNSSGVATFEPNMCAENPFVEPFYNNQGNYAENIAAPMESNYVEKPFGANFFPAPKVTYARVAVKNLDRTNDGVKKHATGSVVTSHFTSFDYPTKVNYTDLKMINGITPDDQIGNMIASIIIGGNLDVRNLLTLSQGFSIETNDMNGKLRFQEVYNEANEKMSSVEYKYNTDGNGNIDNNMTTIDDKGKVEKRLIGIDYDVINDFNKSFAMTLTSGFKANVSSFLIPMVPLPIPIIIPTVFPESSRNVNELRTAVTTKHVHKTTMLVEKIATDLGATVSTKNLAWDASSGEVLLTETVNEYNDHYFSFTYPAYWMYDGMGLASQNIGIEGVLKSNSGVIAPNSSPDASGNPYFKLERYENEDITKYFHIGDELYTPLSAGIVQSTDNAASPIINKVWVIGFSSDKKSVLLMDRNGNYINKCDDIDKFPFKIVRSGYRNLQTASMASVTSMINPIKLTNIATGTGVLDQNSFIFSSLSRSNPRIVNSSAVAYKDFWIPQIESGLPYYPDFNAGLVNNVTQPDGTIVSNNIGPVNQDGTPNYPYNIAVNPFVWNIKGDWKAEKSYAYLTGRNSSGNTINNPRNEGFYTAFSPFYQFINGSWIALTDNWTYASSVTKSSPYGAELENKDALNRHSAAQYGYQYKLPMAVASNSKYQQMGYEGFEENKTGIANNKHFGFNINQNDISKTQSHTGKNSIKVSATQQIKLTRALKPKTRNFIPVDCPVDNGGGGPGGCIWECVTNQICNPSQYDNYEAYYSTGCNDDHTNGGIGLVNLGPGQCVTEYAWQCIGTSGKITKKDTIFLSKKDVLERKKNLNKN